MSEEIPKVFPELGLPPVVPVVQDLLEEYTNKPENLPIHSLERNLRHVRPRRDVDSLFSLHATTFPLVQRVKRDPATGKLVGYEEVETSSLGETAKNSLSLTRAPGAKDEGLKGSSTNFPFWPGGFDEEKENLKSANKNVGALTVDEDEAKLFEKLFEKDLLWVPPGFKEGLALSNTQNKYKDESDGANDLLEVDKKAGLDFWKSKEGNSVSERDESPSKLAKKESKAKHLLNEVSDDLLGLPEEPEDKPKPVLKISQTPSKVLFLPWAEQIDVTKPMLDFEEKVPQMAYTYPFELDTFQKQAIAKLEEHENVFVAAHTSAGKTVVAEYAIALSVQHMTRTIYTSPIKALSNQKFRDFKNTFESVGLVTGDVQINPGAAVLIMTTEILRSMLYNGSDVIRDLEWVVFDEIHYLNNEERGHVWEEVLIMLPPHVSIIMLSATVPNALEFANWVGEIKKKKIYVISTPKRPVPLEHHLYTGSGGKGKEEMFLLLDAEGNFRKQGYLAAKEAKAGKMSKHQQQFGPRGGKNVFSDSTEKNTYTALIRFLEKAEKLPVVIFTFSRNRCDKYAQLLSSVDLCTGKQKAEIHGFFVNSISKLKGTDKELPQVKTFQEMLKNGIGVHHSGILPILKEVVEMLFQKGLVKLLFATETFAMGVNMPARTVVFDSIRKHDGVSFRTLYPAEYIQMAGRAGRRGLDTTGTVLILCKQDTLPDIAELQTMMTGKAGKLESQFRLTYSMILNLLRVESLTVEDVMKRSFLEANSRMSVDTHKGNLQKIKERLSTLEWEQKDKFNDEIMKFCEDAKNCVDLHESSSRYLKDHTKTDLLNPGRLIIVEQLPIYSARLGVILQSSPPKALVSKFTVLILTSAEDQKRTPDDFGFHTSDILDADLMSMNDIKDNFDNVFRRVLYYSYKDLLKFVPIVDDGKIPYKVIEVEPENILDLVNRSLRVDPETILSQIRARDIPRFANEPMPSNVRKVLEDLVSATHTHHELSIIPATQRCAPSKEINIILEAQKFEQMKANVKNRNIEGHEKFWEEFYGVFSFMRLKEVLDKLEYQLSPKSLRLHEEYQSRKLVLRKLGYIDEDNLVQMKGRVACEMGNQNELMVTEMVLNNMFASAPPAEVAAVLSCLVFEAKKVEEPNLEGEPALHQRIKDVKNLAKYIGTVQKESGLKEPVSQFVEQFRFGLAEVVHEWAKGKCFCDIMKLTDVQEGLIVRTIQRLDEMIRDVKDAARIIGDPSLKKKMEESSECIKRDIVFAASLYTQ